MPPTSTPRASSAPPAASAITGGAVPDAGVLLFTDPGCRLWRNDGATGAIAQILLGHSIDAEGPQGVYVTAFYYWSRRSLAWTGPATVRETARTEGRIVARTLEERTRPDFTQYWQAHCPAAKR